MKPKNVNELWQSFAATDDFIVEMYRLSPLSSWQSHFSQGTTALNPDVIIACLCIQNNIEFLLWIIFVRDKTFVHAKSDFSVLNLKKNYNEKNKWVNEYQMMKLCFGLIKIIDMLLLIPIYQQKVKLIFVAHRTWTFIRGYSLKSVSVPLTPKVSNMQLMGLVHKWSQPPSKTLSKQNLQKSFWKNTDLWSY